MYRTLIQYLIIYRNFSHQMFTVNLTKSSNANPNVNYDILHDVMKCAKNKHMPYKTVKLKEYKQKKSTWIMLVLLKSPKYFAIRINLTTYNNILKKAYVVLNEYITNHVLTNSKITLKTWETINGILSRTHRKKTFPNSFIYKKKYHSR